MNALIGYTGFVGSTLLKQTTFERLFNSENIEEVKGKTFDLVVCAGAPAQKWIANKDPDTDRKNIDRLIECLGLIQCNYFILVSTVDVYNEPIDVYEDSSIDESKLQPYGSNRLRLENYVREKFRGHSIVRLPGLVGTGLRKNIIFDFLNANNLPSIDHRNVFQFYPMANLWADLKKAKDLGIRVLNLAAEPINTGIVAQEGFGIKHSIEQAGKPVFYNMKSRYAKLFGGGDNYHYSLRETLLAIRCYAQSEPKTIKKVPT